ncbi:MAG: metallophosphoesterase [Firmicutes bacterium]|nr:metallophosphoesterase [Bacillota bacterium]
MNLFNRRSVMAAVFVVLISISVPICAAADQTQPQYFNLTVVYTNDFHGYDPYALARKATIIKKIRAEAGNVLLVDAGDLYARGPYHKQFYGEMEMAAYNAIGYDVWELGNNEFKGESELAASDQKLYNLINQAKFPTLCANIKQANGEYLPGVKPYFVKQIKGMRVGILGVSSMKVKKYSQGTNKIVEDPVAIEKGLLPELQEQSDIQILLSHAGLAEDVKSDMKLADSGLSLIVGADDHYVIERPIYRSGGIPIVQAGGENNIFLGRIDLKYENKNGKWVLKAFNGRLYPINDKVAIDSEIKQILDKYLAKVQKPAA